MKKILVSVAAALVLPVGIVCAASPPELQEGLWSVRTQTITNPGNKKDVGAFKICHSHAWDKSVEDLAKKMPGCTTVSESLGGGKYSSEGRCTVTNTVVLTKVTTTCQGNTVHVEAHTTYTPAFYGMSETMDIRDDKYEGSCPAGTQPGDTITQDGTVIRNGTAIRKH